MPRYLKVAAAQLGPNNEGTSREEIVERMLGLLTEAAREGVELIAYPEMALTTYFPKKIRPDFDQFFETEVPPKALEPLLSRAAEARIAVHVGFCEKAGGKYFNTALLTDRDGRLCGTFRKIHLPGTKTPDGFAQVFEPYYFAHGDTGYRVFDAAGAKIGIAICQDRRELHHQPARPGARPRRDERRRAGGGADRPRADAPRQEALELPRPAPASALRAPAPAGDRTGAVPMRRRVLAGQSHAVPTARHPRSAAAPRHSLQ